MKLNAIRNPLDVVRPAPPETFTIKGLDLDEARAAAERVADRVGGVELVEVRGCGWFGLSDTSEVTIRGSNGARRLFRRQLRRLARSLAAS